MTLITEQAAAAYWAEPEGIAPRGTLVLTGLPAPPELTAEAAADPVSPLSDARERYAQALRAELVSITGGVHDVLNDATHRTVAATIVLFLERLRLGADLAPIAISEKL